MIQIAAAFHPFFLLLGGDGADQPQATRLVREDRMLLSMLPKCSVSNVMGFIKGKSVIQIARVCAGRRRNYVGQHFWARGYWVSTAGKNEAAVRQYSQNQEKEDKRLEPLELGGL